MQAAQQKIAVKMDELKRGCGELEDWLTAAQTTTAGLLETNLHKSLNPHT